MDRRQFLQLSTALGAMLHPAAAHALAPKRHVLLRSSWQTVNIGDIAHTPGMLRLLEQHLPHVRVTLWPSSVDNGVREMLEQRFPQVRIVEGALDAQGKPTTPELQAAFDAADFFLHGSGPSVVKQTDLEHWRRTTGKPYGVYGVTIGSVDARLRDLLSDAAFMFCRDTISLNLIREQGVTASVMDFGPDATFALDVRHDDLAVRYLKRHGLKDRQFLCVIPRLRYTPYYKIRNRKPTAADLEKEAYSDRFKDVDHAKLRDVMVAWVRQTGLKVLACPEMTYQVELAKEYLVDPLPDDVKPHVIWRDSYWITDEASGVYARARALVSCEMHSPIMCAVHGTPAIYVRQPTDTSKGQMWRDIGLREWIFEIDDVEGADISKTLLQIHEDYPKARNKVREAMEFVRRRQRRTMAVVREAVAKGKGAV